MKNRTANHQTRGSDLKGERLRPRIAPVVDVATEPCPAPTYHNALWEVEILCSLMRRLYQSHLQPLHGLSNLEWHVLDALQYTPGTTAVEFAQSWACDKMALSRAVQHLKQAGLVHTVPATDDRRKVALYLTRHGVATARSHLQVVDRLINNLFDTVAPEELSTLSQTVRRLTEHFRRVTSSTNSGESD
ncbi:MarR family winged helix-turn-helix transcriptional regulator [Paraburkholderia silvatlantica]|uniref:MarR family winged helix-turn-helix transcriptional regulator n=1 Tax=Paraburkholderia silvatlantica TaxID=321895 RepID=UPI003752A187